MDKKSTVVIPKELHKELKREALERGITLQELVELLLKESL